MSGDELIQKNLFGNDTDLVTVKDDNFEEKDLTNEALTKDSQTRPRRRKRNQSNLSLLKESSTISENQKSVINNKSHSFETVNKEQLPPVLKHYVNLKEENSNHFLLYRLGDFFECFFEDAIQMSQILEITLTSKDGGKGVGRVPMAGVPHHALERYCSELIKKNHSVVICDQLEKSNGNYSTPLKRAITRIITPGTIIEEGMLIAKRNNWITAVSIDDQSNKNGIMWGISRADVSTGELITLEGSLIHKLYDEIIKLDISEIIIGSEEERILLAKHNKLLKCTVTQKTFFAINEANKIIKNYFNIQSLEGIGLRYLPHATKSLGGLLHYLKEINPLECDADSSAKISLDFPLIRFPNESLIIDYQTKKNLEITHTQRENNYVGSLLWSIDRTYTAMGARCLRQWIEFPLLNNEEIIKRQNIITNFLESQTLRIETQNLLRAMGDLERLSGRACAGQASARDLIAISEGLKKIPRLKIIIKSFDYALPEWVQELKQDNYELLDLADQISNTLIENPPLNISEGGIIHDGVDNILDGLRNIIDDYSEWLKNEELKERKISKITNLKIQFHRTFGYYISINKSKVNMAPKHWIKRQTLTNEERFITTSIKAQENKIFQVKNRAATREYELFCQIRDLTGEKTKKIRTIARAIASLDALLGLALASIQNNYVKPQIIPKDENISQKDTNFKSGRNPIVEQLLDENKFVPNDVFFNENQKLIILSGPNASGKSCFIRQIGLIQILSQIGSYVPAKKAEIKIVDRIFTRVGAVDDQSTGQSTFMVEMAETASILNQATENSLVLLDEIGRGTSTFDGLSIAWSVSEYLAKEISCKSIFATHYHELNYLKNSLNNVENFQVTVKQHKDELDFCHKIEKGGSNKSYGIEAAKLAGIPLQVINKAQNILKYLEESNNFNNQINLEEINKKVA
tara:strand:+ start:7516 stop:10287 length:2772 start_codon:yes stop_codon:yes gene_type:complete